MRLGLAAGAAGGAVTELEAAPSAAAGLLGDPGRVFLRSEAGDHAVPGLADRPLFEPFPQVQKRRYRSGVKATEVAGNGFGTGGRVRRGRSSSNPARLHGGSAPMWPTVGDSGAKEYSPAKGWANPGSVPTAVGSREGQASKSSPTGNSMELGFTRRDCSRRRRHPWVRGPARPAAGPWPTTRCSG